MKHLLLLILLLINTVLFSQTAEDYYNKAIEKIEARNYFIAAEQLTKAIELNSHEPNYYWLRSKAYANNRMVPEAIQDINTVIGLGVKTAEVYYRKGFLLEHLADNKSPDILRATEQKDKDAAKTETLSLYAEAENNYNLALQVDPENKEASSQLKYLKLDVKGVNELK